MAGVRYIINIIYELIDKYSMLMSCNINENISNLILVDKCLWF